MNTAHGAAWLEQTFTSARHVSGLFWRYWEAFQQRRERLTRFVTILPKRVTFATQHSRVSLCPGRGTKQPSDRVIPRTLRSRCASPATDLPPPCWNHVAPRVARRDLPRYCNTEVETAVDPRRGE